MKGYITNTKMAILKIKGNHKHALIVIFTAAALLLLGGVAAYDFFHIPTLSYYSGSYFERTGVAFVFGAVLFIILFKYNHLFIKYEVPLFFAGLVLMATPLLTQAIYKNYLFINYYLSFYVNPWAFLLTLPLLNSIKKNDNLDNKFIVLRFFLPWASVNLILLLQPDYPMFLLFNVIAAVLIINRRVLSKLKAIIGIAIIVFLVLTVAAAKKSGIERRLEYTKNQLRYMQSNELVVPVTCIYNLKKTGWKGAGIDYFRETVKNKTVRHPARDFIQNSVSVSDFPLKIICQQTGILGFIVVLLLFLLLANSFWRIIVRIKCKSRSDLSVLIFLLLFIPIGIQLFNNILPLAVLPSYNLYFLSFHPHAISFTFAITGLLLGVQHVDNKNSTTSARQ